MTPLDAAISHVREGGASFPLRHRLFRLCWNVVWTLFGRWSPVPLYGWRRFLLRGFGARISATARIYPSALIWYPPHLTMGEHAVMGPGVICYCMDRVTLADYAIVSQRAYLCGGTHDVDDPHFQLHTGPIEIGRMAWIAAEAFVGPRVTVGEGAVVGARGVAMRDVPDWEIWAGNPARRIRSRRRFPLPAVGDVS